MQHFDENCICLSRLRNRMLINASPIYLCTLATILQIMDVSIAEESRKTRTKTTKTEVKEVKIFMLDNPSSSLWNISERISPSKTMMWKKSDTRSKMRFYHHISVQILTDKQKVPRRRFCYWKKKNTDFVKRIGWTVEKSSLFIKTLIGNTK